MAGLVGIGCNLLLFLAKLLVGLLAGSVSITADAVNNLSDASGSIVTLVGFRLAEKPADAAARTPTTTNTPRPMASSTLMAGFNFSTLWLKRSPRRYAKANARSDTPTATAT